MKGTYGHRRAEAKGGGAPRAAARRSPAWGASNGRYINSTSRMAPRLMAISVESSSSGWR